MQRRGGMHLFDPDVLLQCFLLQKECTLWLLHTKGAMVDWSTRENILIFTVFREKGVPHYINWVAHE